MYSTHSGNGYYTPVTKIDFRKKEIILKILKKYHYEIVDKENSENNNHEGRQSY